MAATVLVDPYITEITKLVQDNEHLDEFCMNYGLAPQTVPPRVRVVVGGGRGRAPRSPVYVETFNLTLPNCTALEMWQNRSWMARKEFEIRGDVVCAL